MLHEATLGYTKYPKASAFRLTKNLLARALATALTGTAYAFKKAPSQMARMITALNT